MCCHLQPLWDDTPSALLVVSSTLCWLCTFPSKNMQLSNVELLLRLELIHVMQTCLQESTQAHMSPALNRSYVLQCFESSNAIKNTQQNNASAQ